MSPSIDPNSGFCSQTKTFHSLRPEVTFPPPSFPLSTFAFAFGNIFSSSPLPSHPAFIDSATAAILTYPQLVTRVHSLSSSLQTCYSLRNNNNTAFVISPPNLHIPVIYLSLLRLGIAISPSNPTSSPSEISHQLELANPSVIFATSSTAHKLETKVRVILLDSPHFLSLLESPVLDTLSLPRIEQSDLAAVLFSSGTTGRMKGVVLTHRNIIAALAPIAGTTPPQTSVTMLMVPLFHSFGFIGVLRAVMGRDTAVIMTERFDIGRMMGEVERFRVSSLAVAPPALLAMVRFAENGGGGGVVKSLQTVIFGGAPTGADLLRRFKERFPTVVLAQVPPAELEHLIQMHKDVIEAAVIPYPDEEAGEIPMAFVVRKPDSTLSAVEIMDFVAKKVAPYKRIRRLSFMNSIPKNAAGKILRKDLIKFASSKLNAKL